MENDRTRRILILGAGHFQLPGIRKAAALGYRVITVDYLADNIGHQYSHDSVVCSTVDQNGVLQVAREWDVHGVCTFCSDIAIPSVALVCEQLGLPGVSTEAAAKMSTKNKFRSFQKDAGFPAPKFVSGSSLEAMFPKIQQLRLPVVVKPVDTSGSRGVTRVDEFKPNAIHRAFEVARSFSRTRTVCVEEFVSGIEVGGDAILLDGKIEFIAITHKHMQGFVVSGHSLPTNISENDRQRVIEALQTTCAALGYASGPLNFDAIVAADFVTILEMSPRNGGNGIPAVIERATGVDVEIASLKLAMGEIPTFPVLQRESRGAGSLMFGSSIAGCLLNIRLPDELRFDIPEVFQVYYVYQPGDSVNAFTHNGNMLGFVLFDCSSSSEYDRISHAVLNALNIEVRGG